MSEKNHVFLKKRQREKDITVNEGYMEINKAIADPESREINWSILLSTRLSLLGILCFKKSKTRSGSPKESWLSNASLFSSLALRTESSWKILSTVLFRLRRLAILRIWFRSKNRWYSST